MPAWLVLFFLCFAWASAAVPTFYGMLAAYTVSASTTPVTVTAASGQSADMLDFFSSTPTLLSGIDSLGGFNAPYHGSLSGQPVKLCPAANCAVGAQLSLGGNFSTVGSITSGTTLNSGQTVVFKNAAGSGNTSTLGSGDGTTHCGVTAGAEQYVEGASVLRAMDTNGDLGACGQLITGASVCNTATPSTACPAGPAGIGYYPVVGVSGTTTISGTCSAAGALCALAAYPSCPAFLNGCWWSVYDITTNLTVPEGIVPLSTRVVGPAYKLGGIVNEAGVNISGDTIQYAALYI